jgi:hydroxymethylpyrimidine/phosphomethylpyrimidine kinase
MQPAVLTVAGSDPSGGAGIQADLKAIAANGGYGASVLTAITVQNTQGVRAFEVVSPRLVRAQLDAVFADLDVVAVKTGMLGSAESIRVVASALGQWRPRHYVCDPVLVSKNGRPLLPESCVGILRRELVPLAELVTPNAEEAAALSGLRVESLEDAERAARRILDDGCAAVLVTGGHLGSAARATDLLVTARGTESFAGEAIPSRHTHGTGCTYSAAIATQLARGQPLAEAIGTAKLFVTEAIRHGLAVGRGTGPTDPFFFLRPEGDRVGWLSRLRSGEAER